jgi:hypothetical protein
MEIATFIIGVIVGVVAVALAFELGMKRTSKSEPSSRSTLAWSFSEIRNPKIVAEYLVDVEIPKNSKLIVNQCRDDSLLLGLNVRQSSDVKGNFVLGEDRALILAGPMKKDEIGVWTVEKDILEKLNAYFDESWENALEYQETKEEK